MIPSKMNTGFAVIIPQFVFKIKISDKSSIYTTKLIAINQIFEIIYKKFYQRIVLFTGFKV